MDFKLFWMGIVLIGSCTVPDTYLEEARVTKDGLKNHDLDNNDNFSPDGKWLVYDTRTSIGGIGGCPSIERVNIETGETQTLYEIPDNHEYGPGVGAASYHPKENKVIFIHGLPLCTETNPYQQWRRTGVMVDVAQPNVPINMDSRDVTFPFTPGALRGGTHRHEWRGDGKWIGYTYNDALMKALEDSTGIHWNLRTLAVSKPQPGPVISDAPGENVQGTWYSAVVVKVVPSPKPGSDEISHAASDSWVGAHGYKKTDGTWQTARAFLGKTRDKDNQEIDEVFVVDIPESIDVPGDQGPLEGTRDGFPMPPKGTVQRRLTFTANAAYPGCGGIVRSSQDGSQIAFLGRDSKGIQQVFLVSPLGGSPVQVTDHGSDVQTGVRWHPDGRALVYVWDNSIVLCETSGRPFGERHQRLTQRTEEPPSNVVWSPDGSTLAFNRAVPVPGKNEKTKQIFIVKLDLNK